MRPKHRRRRRKPKRGMSETADSTLLLGPSGSGKTVAAITICSRLGKKVLVLNASPTDYSEALSPSLTVVHSDWTQLGENHDRDLTVVVEDLQALKNKEKELLFSILNYRSRHYGWSIVLVSHSVLNTGLFSLLDFVVRIILTNSSINLRLLKFLLKHYFYPDAASVEGKFSGLGQHQYLQLEPHQKMTAVLDRKLTDVNNGPGGHGHKSISRDDILRFFADSHESSNYTPLLDFLLSNISHDCISLADVSVKMRKASGNFLRVSLIDYIIEATNADQPPSINVISLHKYLCSHVCFPTLLIKNKVLRQYVNLVNK